MGTNDITKSGATAFGPSLSTNYRYVIDLKNNRMSIWMEDCSNKKQWCKGDMLKEDYVTSDNTIPNADPVDYVSPVKRTFTELAGGTKRLELTLTIPFLRSIWMAKYTFDLNPVSVNRIDVLESKMRDQNDELERLRTELNAIEVNPFIKLEAERIDRNSRLQWNKVDCAQFVVDGEDGVVKARIQGVYSIRGVVNSAPSKNNQSVMILKNGVCIQRSYCTYTGNGAVVSQKQYLQQSPAKSSFVSTPLDCVALVEEGDALTVICDYSSVTTSYLSIVGIVH